MRKNGKIISLLTALGSAALVAHIFNRAAFLAAESKRKLAGGNQSYYSWKFGSIYYSQKGEGSPLLLIHAMDSIVCDREWRDMVQYLARDHAVYTIDLPGCGRSEKKKTIYTNYMFVRAVNDFITNVIGEKTDVVTSNLSSSIALMACRESPQLYGKMILINPESFKHMSRKHLPFERMLSRIMMVPCIGTTIYTIGTLRPLIEFRIRHRYFEKDAPVGSDVIDDFYEAAHIGGFAARFAYASMIEHYTDVYFINALKDIKNPLYLIGGENVRGIDYTLRGYRYFNKAARIFKVKGSGMPHLESPRDMARVIRKCLDGED